MDRLIFSVIRNSIRQPYLPRCLMTRRAGGLQLARSCPTCACVNSIYPKQTFSSRDFLLFEFFRCVEDGRMAYVGSVKDDTKGILGREPLLLKKWAQLHA